MPTRDKTPVATVGVVTADRPALLCRALESLLRHCEAHGHRPRLIVVDGSRQPANRTATREGVAALASAGGRGVQYVGPLEADRWLAGIAPSDLPRALVRPGPAGANRNLVLLLSAGESVLMVDDDVLCETWVPSETGHGLAVMGHQRELVETGFFRTRREAFQAVRHLPADLLAEHGALLGFAWSDLVDSHGTPDLAHACSHVRSAVRDGRLLRVRATFAGVAGDAGVYCPYRFLLDDGPLREALWSSRETFAAAFESREMLRIASGRVLTHDAACMATCLGLSNCDLLPPFMPDGRSEDGVFGAMLAASDGTSLSGYLPVGVLHDSGRPSGRGHGTRGLSASESRLAELVLSFVRRQMRRGNGRSPGDWLGEMGQVLMQIGELGGRELSVFVTEVTLERRGWELTRAETIGARDGCPAHWREALQRYRAELQSRMADPGFFLPVEFHGVGTLEAGYRALGRFLVDYGRLLAVWPALWRAAQQAVRASPAS